MSRTYYRLRYRLDGAEEFLLWFSNDEDGVFAETPGQVPSFANEASLLSFARRLGLNMNAEESSVLHDLDAVQKWAAAPRAETLNCSDVLAAWNLFTDLTSSLQGEGASFVRTNSQLNGIYEKVFWGNNVPAVTPKGKTYEPIWTAEEVGRLADLLTKGLELFRHVRNRRQ